MTETSTHPPTSTRTPIAPAVEVTGVSKRYGALLAVDDVSISVQRGEVHGLLGPNGAGKTTLLRMLFGLIRPDAGSLQIFGRSVTESAVRALDGVGGFIESPRFYPYLTGRQHLSGLGLLDGGVGADSVADVLEVVDLTARADDRVGGYSYGMRQRLGVAASLLRSPALLVLDEPANGLDPAGIRDMRALVTRLASTGLTVLLSSHDMDEVEEICDHVTVMSRGTLAFHGTLDSLRARAPEPAHVLRTSDDHRVQHLARSRHGAIAVAPDVEAGLVLTGARTEVSAFVADVVADGVELFALVPTRTPLEELFFMLTDPAPEDLADPIVEVAR